jgi:hypothetical protein
MKNETDLTRCCVCGESVMGCKGITNTHYGNCHEGCYPFNPNLVKAQKEALEAQS